MLDTATQQIIRELYEAKQTKTVWLEEKGDVKAINYTTKNVIMLYFELLMPPFAFVFSHGIHFKLLFIHSFFLFKWRNQNSCPQSAQNYQHQLHLAVAVIKLRCFLMIVTTHHFLAVLFPVSWKSVLSAPVYLQMSIRLNEQGNTNQMQTARVCVMTQQEKKMLN